MIELERLNDLDGRDFVAALAPIFEHSPWVAEQVAGLRPFRSVIALHEAMSRAVLHADHRVQDALIAAHPELAGVAPGHGRLTAASKSEQKGAGLVGLTSSLSTRLRSLNAEYADRFGFPFILAVKGHTAESVIEVLAQRVLNDVLTERHHALQEICRIAYFRLADRVAEPTGDAIVAMAHALASRSEESLGLTGVDTPPPPRGTAALIRDFMLAAGLATRIDELGHVIGVMQGGSGRPWVSTGSHPDTAIEGRPWTRRLCIVLPIAVAAALKRAGSTLPVTLEIRAFVREEESAGGASAVFRDASATACFVRPPLPPVSPDGELSAADAGRAARAFEDFLLHYHVGESG